MTSETILGPRLSDADFFAKIDTGRPGLEEIPEAVARGDFPSARRLLAAEVRRSLQPERFFRTQRQFRGRHFMREGEAVAEAAERILRGELISCGTPHTFVGDVDWFANPTFNKYKEWTWQLSRHPEWGILAERYRETGDERFAEAFVRFFRSWVRQAVVPENAPGFDTLCWRTIEAGIRMGGVWQWALHTFYRSPHVTDDVLIDWYKSVWEHGWRLRNFHRTGNWLIMEMNGLAQIGILYPQFKDAAAWKAYAFQRLVQELDAQIYPDGWQVELSTGYHQVDIHNYQWLMDVCKAYDEPIPSRFIEVIEQMHTVNVLMMMPDGRLPDVNDGGWYDVAPLLEGAIKDYPARSDFVWAHSRGAQGKPPSQTSHAFDYAGYYIMRTGWEPDAVWVLFDGGHFGYGHQHEDKLNLLLHAYGRLLLTEGGNYAYDTSEMRRYVLSTRAHNTIRVDGLDQNRRLNYDRDTFDVTVPSTGRWQFGPDRDVVSAVYDEGYGPGAIEMARHERTAILVKKPTGAPGPFVIVLDRLTPLDGQAHTYQVLWHLNTADATVDGLTVRTNDPGQPHLAVCPARQDGLSVRLMRGQEQPEWQGWTAIKNHQQGEYAPIPTAAYELTASGPVLLATILLPLQASAECPLRGVKVEQVAGTVDVILHLSDGRVVRLPTQQAASSP